MNAPASHPDWDEQAIHNLLDGMSDDLRSHLTRRGIDSFHLVGIHSGGAWVAEALKPRLQHTEEVGLLDITFYRDDFTRRGLNPRVKPTKMPFGVDARHLVLVDDVLMSGRTIRAAMNELFDYGRPASITLAVLFDVGHRQLPISPDICGEALALGPDKWVELHGPTPLSAEIMEKKGPDN
jgi:pyrimidine operon attenuation protein/uracil phosphoribosyltransferase